MLGILVESVVGPAVVGPSVVEPSVAEPSVAEPSVAGAGLAQVERMGRSLDYHILLEPYSLLELHYLQRSLLCRAFQVVVVSTLCVQGLHYFGHHRASAQPFVV